MAKESSILTRIGRFRTVTPVWIHWWLWNDAQTSKQHRRGVVLFFKAIPQISRSHETKNRQVWPKMSTSGLYLKFEFTDGFEMVHNAWHSIEDVSYCFSRSSIKFQGHTGQKIRRLWPESSFSWLTSVGRYKWLLNDAQSLTEYRRGALLFSKIINQISRSHGLKNQRFESNLSITRPVAAIKSLRFALFCFVLFFIPYTQQSEDYYRQYEIRLVLTCFGLDVAPCIKIWMLL